MQGFLLAFDGRGTRAHGGVGGNPALLTGYPVKIPGLIQGYGVAQDFVTQGVESPVVYDTAAGPQAVVNTNLFSQYRVDLRSATVSPTPFALATIPAAAPNSCPTPNSVPPTFSALCTLVPFTTSGSLGRVLPNAPEPQLFQAGSSAPDVLLGITQTPGLGIRVDNGVAGWDPTTGANLAQYSHYIQGLAFFAAPAIADVTGDGVPDVLQGADSSALMGYDSITHQPAAGFPKWTGGWSLFTPATGDVAGGGQTDVAEMTREGYLSIWSTAANGCSGNNEAWHWHQDDRNTGHYGTDTRPPAAITDLTSIRQGGNDVLSFTAPGDNWRCGTAASYQLFTSTSPITQGNVAQSRRIAVTMVPHLAGTRETITIPAAQDRGHLAIRAVDAAGNIGPLPRTAAPAAGPVAAVLPVSGLGAALGVPLAVCAVVAWLVPRRRRRCSA